MNLRPGKLQYSYPLHSTGNRFSKKVIGVEKIPSKKIG
jgi:hypothetical protein